MTDAALRNVHYEIRTLEPATFGPHRATDACFRLPVDRLAAGEYLLTIEARRHAMVTRRAVRFRVR